MRAVEYDAFGPAEVLQVRDAPDPGPPGPGEVRVRVEAASVNPKDTFVRKGRFRAQTGERFPRRTGYDVSGVVEAVGPGTAGLAAGRPVFGMLNGWDGGTCAEVLLLPAEELAAAPASLPLAHAAALPLAGQTALQALTDVAGVVAGARVLINGASGGVGLFAVQIAKALGARVTAVAGGGNEALCRGAGADAFMDYGAGDPLAGAPHAYEVVFDVFGDRSFDQARPALAPGGVYVSTVPSPQIFADAAATPEGAELRARLVIVRSRAADLQRLAAWTDAGLLRPAIDGEFPLSAAADAHRRVETKHTRGKVLIRTD